NFWEMSARSNPVLWIVPESQGGIRSYVEGLRGFFGDSMRPVFEIPNPESLAKERPSLIHVQHEYGLFGSKIPGRYTFPKWFREAREATPGTKWVVTAHSVLDPGYRFPYEK